MILLIRPTLLMAVAAPASLAPHRFFIRKLTSNTIIFVQTRTNQRNIAVTLKLHKIHTKAKLGAKVHVHEKPRGQIWEIEQRIGGGDRHSYCVATPQVRAKMRGGQSFGVCVFAQVPNRVG